ncbi:MAG: GDP-L-fucose synthase [bacterium]|nr:GDP-L-fucose synthase [bacterium]
MNRGILVEKNSKIYLAGHDGLVGSALFQALKKEGYTNIVTRQFSELNLLRQKDVETFFEQEKPEYVFLAAAKVGGILANDTYKAQFIYENIMIAANVIHSAYTYKVKKLLNLGSSCIYPKFAPQPMKEDSLLTGELEPTNEPYAIAKISAIKLCRYYNEQYGTNFISVMPTNLYGVNDNFNLENSHVLPALLRKFHLGKLLRENDFKGIKKDLNHWGKTVEYTDKTDAELRDHLRSFLVADDCVTIWGTGSPYREFLFKEDLAKACVFLMEKYDYEQIGEFINIGTGIDLTIGELAEMIKDIVGFQGKIDYDSAKPDGTPRKLQDVSRLNELGWSASVELRDGIVKTYEWYQSVTR